MPFGGFPWGRVAFSQADSPLLHLVALGGPALLGFAVALLGALGLLAVDVLRERRGMHHLAGVGLAAVLLLLLPLLIPAPTQGTPATLMAIQGNAPLAGLDFNKTRREILDNHGRVTLEAAAQVQRGSCRHPTW
ncbi:hypothetical protein [Mobilicoccus caccae]|uniref:Apolipoprotein N-acyltransferase N-terminal domain-containing protein n=1 Tax=Mobilicoccus caccae TaxID=1859295 RepID=A0ABQ6IR75_9MICO|nr:hypothetical protein GCM10025883_16310 [Mobilicoccus caccae]